jgi:hypothetical protein
VDQQLAAQTIQRIISADTSEVDGILASVPVDIQEEVRRQFRTNQKLRLLFPEYIDLQRLSSQVN